MQTVFGLTDLGVGNGLITRLAQANGVNKERKQRELITAGYGITILAGLFILAIVAIANLLVQVFGMPGYGGLEWICEYKATLTVACCCYVASTICGLVGKIHTGLQDLHVANMWQIIGIAVSFIGLLLCFHQRLGLAWLILCTVGLSASVQATNTFWAFATRYRPIAPLWTALDWRGARRLLLEGLALLWAQAGTALLSISPVLCLGAFAGAQAVGAYGVASRLFSLIIVANGMIQAPLWAAYAEAFGLREWDWIHATLRRGIGLLVWGMLPAGLILGFATPYLIPLWTGERIQATPQIIAGALIISMLVAVRQTFSSLAIASFSIKATSIVLPVAGGASYGLGMALSSHGDLAILSAPATAELLVLGAILYDLRWTRQHRTHSTEKQLS